MAEVKKVESSVEDIQNVRALMIRFGRLYNFEQNDNFFAELQSLPAPYIAPEGGLFIAYTNGLPVGFSAFIRQESDPAFAIRRLYVLEEFRLRGIGKSLLNAAISESKKLGASSFVMNVQNWMDGADELCEACQMNESVLPGISSREMRQYEISVG